MRIKKLIHKQNLKPKNKERFWGKFKPICQFNSEKELNKKGFNKSIKKKKLFIILKVTKKKQSKINNLISHII